MERLAAGKEQFVWLGDRAYGEPWAKLMGAQHVAIDIPRVKFPISGTQLRTDLSTHWHMLTPPAKAYFAKRICVSDTPTSSLRCDVGCLWSPLKVPASSPVY